jgi:hypothetical protein
MRTWRVKKTTRLSWRGRPRWASKWAGLPFFSFSSFIQLDTISNTKLIQKPFKQNEKFVIKLSLSRLFKNTMVWHYFFISKYNTKFLKCYKQTHMVFLCTFSKIGFLGLRINFLNYFKIPLCQVWLFGSIFGILKLSKFPFGIFCLYGYLKKKIGN